MKKIINFSIFSVIYVVRIANLVMGKISYENKMLIETFHGIGFGYGIIVTNFPGRGWKLKSVKTSCLSLRATAVPAGTAESAY